jgi:RNA polymerase sigma factor (sigma-70 family)
MRVQGGIRYKDMEDQKEILESLYGKCFRGDDLREMQSTVESLCDISDRENLRQTISKCNTKIKNALGMEMESLSIDIERVLSTLTPRDSEIVRLCFGLRRFNNKRMRCMTLEKVGEEFELTRERVRQIREKAIVKLRGSSSSEILRAYVA